MAKASKTAEESMPETVTETESSPPPPAAETVMGYFRRIYDENPKWLKIRSNEEVFRRWLADHPDHTEVPDRIKNGLANLKSILRKEKKKGKGKGKAKGEAKVAAVAAPSNGVPGVHLSTSKLEALEQQIDDCIALAKGLDREGLENIIRSLHRARNEVVLRLDH